MISLIANVGITCLTGFTVSFAQPRGRTKQGDKNHMALPLLCDTRYGNRPRNVGITCLTGFTVSFAQPRGRAKRGDKNHMELPLLCGQPYIPGSSQRGRLRHTATRMVVEKRVAHGLPKLTLADVNWLAVGGVRQKVDDAEKPTADVMKQRPIFAKHIWALFGFSEPVFMASAMQIENAMPTRHIGVADLDVIHGQRLDMIQRGEYEPDAFADPQSFDDWLEKATERKGKAIDRDARAKKNAKNRRNKNDENGDYSETDQTVQDDEEPTIGVPANMPFSRQIVPPNSEFTSYIDIRNATELQLGLFVATMRAFSNEPVFGAQVGRNLGLINLSLTAGEHTITIDGRQRSFTVSEGLHELEKRFWDAFPTIDFSAPVLKKRD